MKDAKSNRKYKDSVFTLLFSEKSRLLELYNAIENTNYGSDTNIRITTLKDALFKGRVNDISFVIEDKLVVLIEHQSTLNPNIPLRMLIYMSRVYEKMIDRKVSYSETKISIPKPEFIVLYNGKDEYPDHEVLMLSSMFKDLEDSSLANLELKVNVYNINKGRNNEFAKRSKSLEDYEYFIYLIRENSKAGMSLDDAIELAVRDCVKQGVLEEFLTEHGSEVNNMLLNEWNLDEAKEVWREDGRHEGIAIGEARGVEKGVAIGEARGMEKGRHEGHAELFALLESGISLADAKRRLGV